jgi:phosphosulfolactate phosphohydrolase-like enzyme
MSWDHRTRSSILWNCGVKLASVNSETVDHLKVLQDRGVEIILCRTCLEYFGLEDTIGAGEIDGMVRIQDVLTTHHVLTV